MTKFPSTMTFGALALFASAISAFGQDQPPPRTPWQAAEPTPGEAVRWVVEGCAAYPVTVEAEPEAPGSETEIGVALETMDSSGQH